MGKMMKLLGFFDPFLLTTLETLFSVDFKAFAYFLPNKILFLYLLNNNFAFFLRYLHSKIAYNYRVERKSIVVSRRKYKISESAIQSIISHHDHFFFLPIFCILKQKKIFKKKW